MDLGRSGLCRLEARCFCVGDVKAKGAQRVPERVMAGEVMMQK